MFAPEDILYEDNHLLIVNKRCGDLVQPDPSGGDALERQDQGVHPAAAMPSPARCSSAWCTVSTVP